MTSKAQELYESVLNHIKLRTGNLVHPEVVIGDYEQGLMNAASAVFPEARLQGCFFHYGQVNITTSYALVFT